MKTLLRGWGAALLALALLPGASHAQSIQEIRGVPQLPQVLPTDDQGYAVLYRSEAGEDGQDVYALHLLDPALKARHQYMLSIPLGAAPLPKLAGKSSVALPYYDQSAARLSLYTFNLQTGNHLRRDLAALPTHQRVPSGVPLLATTPTEGYCVVQPFRRDTAGYTITMLDRDLKTQWSRMYFPTDLRQHVPLKVAVSKDVVALVLADSYVLNPNTREQRSVTDVAVLGLDRATGKVLYRSPVRQGQQVLMPEQLLALADGRVAATGLYAQPQAPRRDSVLGVFMTYYKADGRAGAPVLTPWAELGTRLNDPALGRRLYDHQASLQFEDLLTTTGTDAKLVGQYAVAGQPGPFVVLNYAPTGALASLYPVARTFKNPPAANDLRNSHYRGVVGRQGEPYLVYTGTEGTQEYAYATVLAETPARSAARAATAFEKLPELPAYTTEPPMASSPAVDRFTSKLMALGEKMNSGIEAVNKVIPIAGPAAVPAVPTYQPDQLASFVVGPPGQALVYRYEPSRKMLRMQVQPLK